MSAIGKKFGGKIDGNSGEIFGGEFHEYLYEICVKIDANFGDQIGAQIGVRK